MSAPPPNRPPTKAGPSGTQPNAVISSISYCNKCGHQIVSYRGVPPAHCLNPECVLNAPRPPEDVESENRRLQAEINLLRSQQAQGPAHSPLTIRSNTSTPARPADDTDQPVDLMAAADAARAKGDFYKMFLGGQAIANEERVSNLFH